MNTIDPQNHNDAGRPVINWRYPRVYTVLIALIAWFVFAAWWFASGGLVDYLLVVVSGFFLVIVGLQFILLHVGHADPGAPVDRQASLRDWKPFFPDWKDNFDTGTGELSGAEAAAQILLPVAAAAIGMTLIVIVFNVVERGGA